MPNSYNFAPGLIIGNLTVTGDEIKVGKASPFIRLGKNASLGNGFVSYNIDPLTNTRDDVTKFSVERRMNQTALAATTLVTDSASGTTVVLTDEFQLTQDFPQTVFTGSLAERILLDRILPAGFFAARGGFFYRLFLNVTVQGAAATHIRIKFSNQTVLHDLTFTATGQLFFVGSLAISDDNTTAFGDVYALSGTAILVATQQSSIALSGVDARFTVTIQTGATTDSWTLEGFKIDQLVGAE